jgi:hypothetical protein
MHGTHTHTTGGEVFKVLPEPFSYNHSFFTCATYALIIAAQFLGLQKPMYNLPNYSHNMHQKSLTRKDETNSVCQSW